MGNIRYIKNGRTHRIKITIKQSGDILVSYPRFVSLKRAKKFFEQNIAFVRKTLSEIDKNKKKFLPGDAIELITAKILLTDNQSIRKTNDAQVIYIGVPNKRNALNKEAQEQIRLQISEAVKSEARKYLPGRTAELAEKFGFTYNKVFIKNAKTRWGSCSVRNNINLNQNLMRLPKHLCDYVILHELAHTTEKNHGEKFWKKLNSVTNGKAKQYDKELRKFGICF